MCIRDRSGAVAGRSPHVFFTASILLLTVAGKLGDAFAPALLTDWPLTLLILNSNDLHVSLTSTSVPLLPWFVIALLRRLAEDPLFFLVGWYYRDSGIQWLRQWSPGAADGIAQAEAYFRKASYAAVVIHPGAIVCTLAGAAKMQPGVFFCLNVAGTSVRLLLIRGVTTMFPEPFRVLRGLVQEYQRYLLAAAVLLTLFATWKMLRPKSKEESLSGSNGEHQE
eukprot:TRINITY_DN25336_c0_g1_i2.p1 TRINITY_DN25336_c0_g1~~TRINITY_DN25336_c0_g1_i2.p1  ORF type:complete len:223 (-),score=36.36 TRINITY_DN25336_c0_g1_i2:215-883(-)